MVSSVSYPNQYRNYCTFDEKVEYCDGKATVVFKYRTGGTGILHLAEQR